MNMKCWAMHDTTLRASWFGFHCIKSGLFVFAAHICSWHCVSFALTTGSGIWFSVSSSRQRSMPFSGSNVLSVHGLHRPTGSGTLSRLLFLLINCRCRRLRVAKSWLGLSTPKKQLSQNHNNHIQVGVLEIHDIANIWETNLQEILQNPKATVPTTICCFWSCSSYSRQGGVGWQCHYHSSQNCSHLRCWTGGIWMGSSCGHLSCRLVSPLHSIQLELQHYWSCKKAFDQSKKQ